MSKLAVVSGGTKGIGRAIVEKLALQGFDIAVCARSEAGLTALKEHIESTHRTRLLPCGADFSAHADVDRFARFVLELQRPIDMLVNNAGHFAPGGVTDGPDGLVERMLEINLLSAYRLTRALAGSMKQAQAGHIFLLCSVASLAAYPNGGAYSISKFALLGLAKALRQELMKFGVRVTAVMPGATLTASWESAPFPESRFMKPSDVADAIYGAYALSGSSVIEEILMRPQLGDL